MPGPSQVTLGGQPIIGFASDKTRALLAYLVVEAHHPHRRQTLIELLWPDSPARTAQDNLDQALSDLYHIVGDRQAVPPFLLVSQETVRFNPASDHWLDVRAFNELIQTRHKDHPHLWEADESALKPLQRAVELYRGVFLEDLTVGESVPFEEWTLFTREKLHRLALDALSRLADAHEERGEYEQACVYARRQIELEPWREAAHRQLMRALAFAGQRGAALSQYETCRQTLVEELGVEPAEGTTALHQQIRDRAFSISRQVSAVPVFSVSTVPSPHCPYRGLFAFREQDAPFFFGREAFTERLLETVRQQTLVAVIGPSGSGKSSVAFAGLLPHLRREGTWAVTESRPGGCPFHALTSGLSALIEPRTGQMDALAETGRLAEALSRGALSLADVASQILDQQRTQGVGRLLLVFDQFEELYTLCPDTEIRRHFLDQLLLATQAEGRANSLHLVLTLRADFMGQALAHHPFADALQDAALMLGPMSRQELGWAIENPAKRQGVAFEAGLAARILDDVGDEPGNLPLLQFALTALWERQAGGLLTHTAYETVGRV